MEIFLSFVSDHPKIFFCALCLVGFFLYALIGSVSRAVADVKMNRRKYDFAETVLKEGYEYIEVGEPTIVQKHGTPIKEKNTPSKQQKKDNITKITEIYEHLKGGTG